MRGGTQLAVGDFIFIRDGAPRKLSSGSYVVYWYCNQKKSQGCKARLRTRDNYESSLRDSIVSPIPTHCHPADYIKIETAEVYTRLVNHTFRIQNLAVVKCQNQSFTCIFTITQILFQNEKACSDVSPYIGDQ